MFILKNGHQPGVYVPLRALFLVLNAKMANGESIIANTFVIIPWYMYSL